VYDVDTTSEPGRVTLAYGQNWPALRDQANPITVRHTCGYGDDSADVPAAVRVAIQMLAADLYEHPEAQPEFVYLKNNPVYHTLLAAYTIPEVA